MGNSSPQLVGVGSGGWGGGVPDMATSTGISPAPIDENISFIVFIGYSPSFFCF